MTLPFRCFCATFLVSFTLSSCYSSRTAEPPSRPSIIVVPAPKQLQQAVDALDEVNKARQAKGLAPFLRDEQLAQGAKNAAFYRAQHRREGHTKNDFDFLPKGAHAKAAGCAAWPDKWGWGACCTFDKQYRYAGAAWARGSDNLRYMHLFVR